jgi:hypothetical protein
MINSPVDEYSSDGDVKGPRVRKLGRSVSSHPDIERGLGGGGSGETAMILPPSSDISSIDEEPKASGSGSSEESSSIGRSVEVVNETNVAATKIGPKRKAKNMLLYPWTDKKSNKNLAPPQRQRSRSYSDLLYNSREQEGEEGDKLLPNLTLAEVKAILIKHDFKEGSILEKSDGGEGSPRKFAASLHARVEIDTGNAGLVGRVGNKTPLGLGSALLPAASIASLDSKMISEGMKNLHLPVITQSQTIGDELSSSKSSLGINNTSPLPSSISSSSKMSRGGRPRLLSQPAAFLIPDSIHTAPVLSGNQTGAMKFFLPYFRRTSQVSTVSQSCPLSVSLLRR